MKKDSVNLILIFPGDICTVSFSVIFVHCWCCFGRLRKKCPAVAGKVRTGVDSGAESEQHYFAFNGQPSLVM